MTTKTTVDIALCDRCAQHILSDEGEAIEVDGQEPEPTVKHLRGVHDCFHCGEHEMDPQLFEIEEIR